MRERIRHGRPPIYRIYRRRVAWNFVRRVQAVGALRALQALYRRGGA